MPMSGHACDRLRARLMDAAKAAGTETLEIDGGWLPLDRSLPVVFFEPGIFDRVMMNLDRAAEFHVLQVEQSRGAWYYNCRAVVRDEGPDPYDRTYTHLTDQHVERHFMAWMQAIWPDAGAAAPSTIHLPSITSATRRPTISNDEAHQIRAALEGTLSAVEAELHAGRFPEPVEHDLRLLLHQLHSWSNMVEPTTQGFEHILAEITRRIIDNTTDPHSMRHRLIELGADPMTAAAVDASIRDALNAVPSLGGIDDRVDAAQLAQLAHHGERIDDQLLEVATSAPGDGEIAQAIKKGAGNEVGTRAVRVAIQTVIDNWDRIRLGLAVAWKSIAGIFLSEGP